MSDFIKHECGFAMIRLRKPLDYYLKKYDTPLYALNRLYLLMGKQRNRGQDGVGVVTVKLNVPAGDQYIYRERLTQDDAISRIFRKVMEPFDAVLRNRKNGWNADCLKRDIPHFGEIHLGHLRYGTHGANDVTYCHPMIRRSNWRARNLVMAGNFNMTNCDELFQLLIDIGQHPRLSSDTATILEKTGHFLDEHIEEIVSQYRGKVSPVELSEMLPDKLDLQSVLANSFRKFDGGYVLAGTVGSGHVFVARDPAGIRPAYYYADDEVLVAASEKPPIKTAFNIDYDAIREVTPGHALIIGANGEYAEKKIVEPIAKRSCTFERIYFSRGTDPEIYRERIMLGRLLCPRVLQAVNFDLENTVFSYIPNTAENAFMGMVSGLEDHIRDIQRQLLHDGDFSAEAFEQSMALRPRIEKIVLKDVKSRTFITNDSDRDEMVAHVYDTTYGVVRQGIDTVVVFDDSIVRGTTLEKSILKMLDRIHPKRIIIVSSAPQIRYPDCYGIDMSRMGEFIAFRACISLLKERGMGALMSEVYVMCKEAIDGGRSEEANHVKRLYEPFEYDEISKRVADIVRSPELNAEVDVIYQTIDGLYKACPGHKGDWYFTGDYPTPGGNRVVNQSFVNYIEGRRERSY